MHWHLPLLFDKLALSQKRNVLVSIFPHPTLCSTLQTMVNILQEMVVPGSWYRGSVLLSLVAASVKTHMVMVIFLVLTSMIAAIVIIIAVVMWS